MTLQELQQQRAGIVQAIQRKGGAANAPNYSRRLQEVDAQIAAMNNAPQQATTQQATPQIDSPQEQIAFDNSTKEELQKKLDITNDAITRREGKNLESPNYTERRDALTQALNKLNADEITIENPSLSQTSPLPYLTDEIAKIGNTALDSANTNLRGSDLEKTFKPELSDRQTTENLSMDRQRVEEDVFNRLFKGVEQDYSDRREKKLQELRNKGIPYDSNPNSRYQRELQGIDDQFEETRLQARQTATGIGGTEYERQFGIGETLRKNQFDEQAGTRNQQLGENKSLVEIGIKPSLDIATLSEAEKDRMLKKLLAEMDIESREKISGANSPFNG